ncbi:hypothetical protein [Zobellella taiwanensis]
MANPKLSSAQQRKIEVLIRLWNGKLTWERLVRMIELELGIKTTRQTLATYTGIAVEYKNKKNKLRGISKDYHSLPKQADINMHEKVKRLQATIDVLEKNNAEQLRLIERIFMNVQALTNLDLRLLVAKRPEEK